MSQLEALLDVVSPRTGILKSLTMRVRGADQPSVPVIYESMLSNFDFRKAEPIERAACGKGITEDAAMLGAIGEGIERYCSAHVPVKDMVREAWKEGYLAPTDFVLYSAAQYARKDFPYWRWKAEDEILWTDVTELGGGTARVPASFVYLAQAGDQPQDFMFGPNSSGFAAGPDLQTAIRSALMELIERDAFMRTWLLRRRAREIELPAPGGVIGDIRATYERWGTTIRAFALPTDLPATVVMAVALDRTGKGPAVIVGLGCDMNPRQALRKSLFEICQMHEPLRRRHADGTAAKLNAYSDVRTIDDHAAYFFRAEHLGEMDFLLGVASESPVSSGGNEMVRVGDLEDHSGGTVDDDLGTLRRGFEALGYRAFYRDVTTSDLTDYPIRVVRALVTQLQPITFGFGLERLGGSRVAGEVNPCPHPLA